VRNTLFTLISTIRSHSSGSPLATVAGDIASRVGEQNVDGTEPVDCRFDHGRDIGRFRQIEGQAMHSEPSSSANPSISRPSAQQARA
jgi:hypothetical protein